MCSADFRPLRGHIALKVRGSRKTTTVPSAFLALSWFLIVGTGFPSDQIAANASHPPTEQQARELLRAICPSNIATHTIMPGRSYLGCERCPSFTTVGGLRRRSRTEPFDLRTVIYGSFTAPAVREVVGDFWGCEDHANTANFQASVLLRKGPKGWRMIRYKRVETSKCQAYRLPTGRDILICQEFTGHSDEARTWVSVYDFRLADGGSLGQALFGVTDDWGACRSTAIRGSIDKVELRDLDQDGSPDVRIFVGVTREESTGDFGVCAADYVPPPAEVYQLDFLSQQGRFVVAPWSGATKTTLDAIFTPSH